MADPTQDQLSPEDAQALIHAQQQLYAAGDQRAAKLYNYIVQAGYADKGPSGELLPKLDTSNPQGQGLYQMVKDGQTTAVPYGQVQAAAQRGYTLADPQQFARDQAADPNRKGGTSFLTSPQPADAVQREHQIEDSASAPMQVIGGIAKGAATLARPALDAMNYVANGQTDSAADMTDARTGLQKAGKYGTIAAATVPALVAAPVATVAGAAAGALGSGAGQLIGGAARLSPGTTTLLSDALGLGAGVAGVAGAEGSQAAKAGIGSAAEKFFPSFFSKTPEGLLTRAAKPYKNNINWEADVQTAIPLMKTAEQQIGKPISGIDDALQAATAAKQNVWQQVQARLSGASQRGATIDGNQIADAMVNSIGPRMRQNNPGLVEQIQQQAQAYRRPMSVDEAEQFLSGKDGVNNELASYYKKNNADRRAAEADPDIAYKVAEGDALRDALYSKLDDLSGPGVAQLKQAYGALSNVQRELLGRKIVWERQNPVSLAEQVSTARGAGKIAKGIIPVPGLWNPGDVAEGAQNIAVARLGHQLNDPNVMITRAFQNAQPAQPFPAPNFRAPMGVARQLPAQSGAPTILPYYPEMSAGERLAAVMQMIRENRGRQLGLPASSAPIQLPPPR